MAHETAAGGFGHAASRSRELVDALLWCVGAVVVKARIL
jgi:hypothetical protein